MGAARLVPYDLLDPREAAAAARWPIAGAVNIPCSELPDRIHELPPPDQEIGIVGPARLAREVVSWLAAKGRRGVAVETPGPRRESKEVEIGRLWEPNAFLREVLPQLRRGAGLDLACGAGRDAVYLSSCGWDVTAVDVLPDALSRARGLAALCAPALRPIRWLELDLERAVPEFERGFDLIAAFRFLHRPLLARLHEWLRPGGSIVCETFTTVHRGRYGRPSQATRVLEPGELPELVAGLEIRHHSEAWRGRAHTARLWAVQV